jgi:hypothetical protein
LTLSVQEKSGRWGSKTMGAMDCGPNTRSLHLDRADDGVHRVHVVHEEAADRSVQGALHGARRESGNGGRLPPPRVGAARRLVPGARRPLDAGKERSQPVPDVARHDVDDELLVFLLGEVLAQLAEHPFELANVGPVHLPPAIARGVEPADPLAHGEDLRVLRIDLAHILGHEAQNRNVGLRDDVSDPAHHDLDHDEVHPRLRVPLLPARSELVDVARHYRLLLFALTAHLIRDLRVEVPHRSDTTVPGPLEAFPLEVCRS